MKLMDNANSSACVPARASTCRTKVNAYRWSDGWFQECLERTRRHRCDASRRRSRKTEGTNHIRLQQPLLGFYSGGAVFRSRNCIGRQHATSGEVEIDHLLRLVDAPA